MWDTCETLPAGGEAKQKDNWRISVRSLWPVHGVFPLFLAYLGIIGIYSTAFKKNPFLQEKSSFSNAYTHVFATVEWDNIDRPEETHGDGASHRVNCLAVQPEVEAP